MEVGSAGSKQSSGASGALPLRALLLLAPCALVVVIALVFAGLIVTTHQLRLASDRRTTSEQAIAAANQTEKLLLDLETGERGFVITRSAPFLGPWEAALTALPRAIGHQGALVEAEPQQEQLVGEIRRGVAAYIAVWSRPLVAVARRDPAQARRLVAQGAGKRRVEALRRLFARFVAREQALALQRTHQADQSASA